MQRRPPYGVHAAPIAVDQSGRRVEGTAHSGCTQHVPARDVLVERRCGIEHLRAKPHDTQHTGAQSKRMRGRTRALRIGVQRGSVAACAAAESAQLQRATATGGTSKGFESAARPTEQRQATSKSSVRPGANAAMRAPGAQTDGKLRCQTRSRRRNDPTPGAERPDANNGSAAQAELCAQQMQRTPHERLGARDAAQEQPFPHACSSCGSIPRTSS